jgi:hypothetical protein
VIDNGVSTTAYGVDTNWYADSGASGHITNNLEKLTVRDRYNGHDQVTPQMEHV